MSAPNQPTGDKGKKPSSSSTSASTSASTNPSANGESSSSKPAKPPKAAKTEPEAGGTGAKVKSAKDLKKEKRAALVAARGAGGGDETATSSEQAQSTTQKGGNAHGHGSNTNSNGHTHGHAGTSSNFAKRAAGPASEPISAQQDVFFSHLPAHKNPNTREAFDSSRVHPTVVRLGVLMASGSLRGANARTIGMMSAFQEVIRDYQTPESAIMWKDLMSHLSPMITYLEGCRPKGQGGGNAIRWLKSEINRIGEEGERSEAQQKDYLIKAIDSYLEVRISLADQVIADTAREKIRPGATVVTFARSSVVERVLLDAWTEMRSSDSEASFSVVVVDSRPLNEGRNLLDSLTSHGVPCTYVLLTQASHLISRASLVLLGASALHSDGALYSRAGTAMVAMIAKEHRIPVVACVETYKFGERVQLDGLANNELGIGEDVYTLPGGIGKEINQEKRDGITPLCLLYDLTPPDCITAVCTEIGFIPPSSVPTVLGKGSGVQ